MAFAATLALSSLNGTTGYTLYGIDAGDQSGRQVSNAGDVNGDGFDDFLIASHLADANAGEVYLVFGKAGGFTASFDLSALNGTNGTLISGIDAADNMGWQIGAAGDVNGDGFDDIIIGAPNGDPNGDAAAGEAYVIYGRANGWSATWDLGTNSLNGANGFVINGIDPNDQTGTSVAGAGDVNGDGYDDIIVSAIRGDRPGTPGPPAVPGETDAGEVYVIFGGAASANASFDPATLNGTNGFILRGVTAGDLAGISVSSAGDVNGDGFDDLLIGAHQADPGATGALRTGAGNSYVVFGQASGFAATIDLASLNGTNGYVINGIDAGDTSGADVSAAGDVNGDGFADIIIGAYQGDPGSDSAAGESYVIFGKAGGYTAAFNPSTLDGTNGFIINGIDAGDSSGFSVSTAGDVNGDGFDDLIIGAFGGLQGTNAAAGETYVVFGKATGFSATLDLSTLNGTNGFIIQGIDASDSSGVSVSSAGDVNGDGYDDLIVGAAGGSPGATGAVRALAGESYIIFGRPSGNTAGTANADTLNGGAGNDALSGMAGDDIINGAGGNDTLDGGAGNDTMDGGAGNDVFIVDAAGDIVTEAANGGTDEVRAGVSYILSANVENLLLTGADAINGTGNAGANSITGNNGVNTLDGGDGDDLLNGGAGNDVLLGGAGSDRLDGGTGVDAMSGGAGNDVYVVDAAGDTITESANGGVDTVLASSTYRLAANLETLTLTGTAAINGTGNGAANTINGNSAVNIINAASGNDLVYGNDGNDTLYGGAGIDNLLGGAGNDILDGGAERDTLYGNAGNDRLDGGAGRDVMSGAAGADSFVFDDGDFGGTTAATADRILDFSHAQGDLLDFAGVDAVTGGADSAFAFIGTAAFSGTAGELRYEVTGANTFVTGDINGDGVADFMVQLDGTHALVAADFVL